MKRIIYILLPVLFVAAQALQAQTTTLYNIGFDRINVEKNGNSVTVDLKIVLDKLKLGTSDMIILTPMLRSDDGKSEFQVQPVVITGKQRSITLRRAIDMEGFKFDVSPQGVFRRYNGKAQSIDFTLHAPYEKWVDNSHLVVKESLMCCGLTTATTKEYTILQPLVEAPPVKEALPPDYQLSYIMPPVEEVKQRSETHSALVNFRVGKDKIERGLKDNAEILDKVEKIIKSVQENKDLSGTEFRIIGYASPEGNHLSNMKLSENRSKAFAAYLTETHNIPEKSIKTDWVGDDWIGLRAAVDSSDIQYKAEILKALEEINPARRKTRLAQIAAGKAYRILLDDFYPPLRRIEYTISYVAKNFNIEEAKSQLKQNPRLLSLNEMFLVANSYPKSSNEFKEVFEIAARVYPDDPIAQQNATAINIENDKTDDAVARLESLETAEACNNIGVAYAKMGDYEQAIEYFKEAISKGSKEAAENLKIAESNL